MSEPERYDAPNQQVVRADGSGPADEGEGGSAPKSEAERLDAMTKAELLEEAATRGVEVDAAMTKAEIRSALETPQEAG
jgi:hypothetical protein